MGRVSLDILVVPEQDVVIQRTGEDLVVGSLGIVLRQRATHRLELELRMHRRDLFPRKTRRCRNVTGRRADLVGDLHVGDAFRDLGGRVRRGTAVGDYLPVTRGAYAPVAFMKSLNGARLAHLRPQGSTA